MPTVLITGASGYLAHRLLPMASEHAEVVAVARNVGAIYGEFARKEADITDVESVRRVIEATMPDVIIHAAASNPGQDVETMEAVNHYGAAHIATVAADLSIRLICVSTDVVHNGIQAPFSDAAPADPQIGNEYGRTKALGEQAVLSRSTNAVIVRTSLIYGLEKMDQGTEGFAERLHRGETLKLFHDVLRQPVWIDALADALCTLAFDKVDVQGIINVAGSEVLSRAEFAFCMMDFWQIDHSNLVEQVSGTEIPGLPVDLRLQLDRARTLGLQLPGVSQVLAHHAL